MTPEEQLLIEVRSMGLYAIDECNSYDCIADILGVNLRKKEVYEFEFKRSSEDLKIAEKKKWKYACQKIQKQRHSKYKKKKCWWDTFNFAQELPRPHRFYYVMPLELWEKEKEYLMQDKYCGVFVWTKRYPELNDNPLVLFHSVKKVKKRESNTQKVEVVLRDITSRATNKINMELSDRIGKLISDARKKINELRKNILTT